jgi:hypothetical protein
MSGSASFHRGEEVLVCRLGLRGVALYGIGFADLEMRECSDGFIQHNSAVDDDFLRFGRCFVGHW